MPIAPIVFGAMLGGLLGGVFTVTRGLWRYMTGSEAEQAATDAKMTIYVMDILNAVAQAKYGVSFSTLPSSSKQIIIDQVHNEKVTPQNLRTQLNAKSKELFGKTFSRLRKAEQEHVLSALAV